MCAVFIYHYTRLVILIISMNVINVLELRSVCVRWEEYSAQQQGVVMAFCQSLASEEFSVMSVGSVEQNTMVYV